VTWKPAKGAAAKKRPKKFSEEGFVVKVFQFIIKLNYFSVFELKIYK